VDQWEGAHFHAEELRKKTGEAKKEYESGLRAKFFHFK
jgi:hypothetical protein